MMNIYTIRHGETEWNKVKRLQGRSDIPLSEVGRNQAAITAAAIKDLPLAAIFSSPLIRARETAEIIRGDRQIPIYTDPDLVEMSFGIYEGRSRYYKEYGYVNEGFMNNFFNHPDLYTAPEGGESYAQVCERGTAVLNRLIAREKEFEGQNILVAAHGAILRGLTSTFTMDNDLAKFWDIGIPQNCSICKIEVRDGKAQLTVKDRVYID